VEVDGAFGGLGGKIRGFVIYAQTHVGREIRDLVIYAQAHILSLAKAER
jgi:hypothetical protein